MKNLSRIAIMCGVVMLASCEDGSYFNSETKQLKSDHVGRLEAAGGDLRIYEFTPQSRPDYTCIFVAGDKRSGLQCIPKR